MTAHYCPHWGTYRAAGDELEPTRACRDPWHHAHGISADAARHIVAADRWRRLERKRRARQRRAQIAARWAILAAFLAALGVAGWLEGLTP